VGLEHREGVIALAVWPAELKDQARSFYAEDRAAALLDFLACQDEWRAEPAPHLGFHLASRPQRLYTTPAIALEEYLRQWSGPDLAQAGGHPREALRGELWPWLVARGYASPGDAAELPRFERALGRRRQVHLRPAVRVLREWHADAPPLPSEVRRALEVLLPALGEPQLRPA
jgi:hypothetical protein